MWISHILCAIVGFQKITNEISIKPTFFVGYRYKTIFQAKFKCKILSVVEMNVLRAAKSKS